MRWITRHAMLCFDCFRFRLRHATPRVIFSALRRRRYTAMPLCHLRSLLLIFFFRCRLMIIACRQRLFSSLLPLASGASSCRYLMAFAMPTFFLSFHCRRYLPRVIDILIFEAPSCRHDIFITCLPPPLYYACRYALAAMFYALLCAFLHYCRCLHMPEAGVALLMLRHYVYGAAACEATESPNTTNSGYFSCYATPDVATIRFFRYAFAACHTLMSLRHVTMFSICCSDTVGHTLPPRHADTARPPRLFVYHMPTIFAAMMPCCRLRLSD